MGLLGHDTEKLGKEWEVGNCFLKLASKCKFFPRKGLSANFPFCFEELAKFKISKRICTHINDMNASFSSHSVPFGSAPHSLHSPLCFTLHLPHTLSLSLSLTLSGISLSLSLSLFVCEVSSLQQTCFWASNFHALFPFFLSIFTSFYVVKLLFSLCFCYFLILKLGLVLKCGIRGKKWREKEGRGFWQRKPQQQTRTKRRIRRNPFPGHPVPESR